MTNETQARGSVVDRVRDYLQATRVELRKVVWPSREDTVNLTGVVLLVTGVMTLILGGLDAIFSALVAMILRATGNL